MYLRRFEFDRLFSSAHIAGPQPEATPTTVSKKYYHSGLSNSSVVNTRFNRLPRLQAEDPSLALLAQALWSMRGGEICASPYSSDYLGERRTPAWQICILVPTTMRCIMRVASRNAQVRSRCNAGGGLERLTDGKEIGQAAPTKYKINTDVGRGSLLDFSTPSDSLRPFRSDHQPYPSRRERVPFHRRSHQQTIGSLSKVECPLRRSKLP